MSSGAFFDVDGTLINTRSLISFLPHLQALPGMRAAHYEAFRAQLGQRVREGQPREALNAYYFSVLAGLEVSAVEAAGREWLAQQARAQDFYNDLGLALLREQRQAGARICLVTGSFAALVRPLAQALQVSDMLCSTPQAVDGRYTGALDGAPCIGAQKVRALQAYALQHGLDLARCTAVGDDPTDQPMLEAVGASVLVPTAMRYVVEWQRAFPGNDTEILHG